MNKKAPYRRAMETAVGLLSRRDHTDYELRAKLRKRGVSDRVADDVLAECQRLNYLDDSRFAAHYAAELKRKGFGLHRIRHELKRKGVEARVIELALSSEPSAQAELETAWRAFEKKRYRFDAEPDLRKRRAKIYRYLYSRGFSGAIISEVIGKTEQ